MNPVICFRFPAEVLVAAGRPKLCPVIREDLLSTLFGAPGGRCGCTLGPGATHRGHAGPRRGVLWRGTKRQTLKQVKGRRAHAPVRTSHPGLLPIRTFRLGAQGSASGKFNTLLPLQSTITPLTTAFAKRLANACHLPSHPQRCGQIARVAALLLFVKQALSLGRRARGMWRIPGKDYINQSIISPEKPSTNESKS